MGRVSTCQKNCNTIDLRGAQVNNTIQYKIMILIECVCYNMIINNIPDNILLQASVILKT